MAAFLAFLLVAAVVIVTPGQDTALTIRNTLAGGRAAGVRTAAGVVCGQAVWVLTASAGIAAVLVASEPAFVALKLLGAAYLVFLGVRTLIGISHHSVDVAHPGDPLRQGLLSNLGNPKMAVFFTSLLPQFAHSFFGLAALGLVFCAMTLAWLSAYAVVVHRAGDVLRRPRVRRTLDVVTGTALVALGIRLARAARAA
jgi:threonine/homoserine/homoserine lactone efflux protein